MATFQRDSENCIREVRLECTVPAGGDGYKPKEALKSAAKIICCVEPYIVS
ncbi:MAG: hypothetical protein FWG21_07475 [Oscillospiraceae bacterium]|nr:hypothetical protein [Oscillospiraceae bacterium]